jgi:hypothetical protein
LEPPYQPKNNGTRASGENREAWSPLNARCPDHSARERIHSTVMAGLVPAIYECRAPCRFR